MPRLHRHRPLRHQPCPAGTVQPLPLRTAIAGSRLNTHCLILARISATIDELACASPGGALLTSGQPGAPAWIVGVCAQAKSSARVSMPAVSVSAWSVLRQPCKTANKRTCRRHQRKEGSNCNPRHLLLRKFIACQRITDQLRMMSSVCPFGTVLEPQTAQQIQPPHD